LDGEGENNRIGGDAAAAAATAAAAAVFVRYRLVSRKELRH